MDEAAGVEPAFERKHSDSNCPMLSFVIGAAGIEPANYRD